MSQEGEIWKSNKVSVPKGKELQWLKNGKKEGEENKPKKSVVQEESGELSILPQSSTDFWNRTYYEPLLLKGNGHGLVVKLEEETESVGEVSFELFPIFQFDQGGVLLYGDEDNWVKAGMEVVDGVGRASVVVTVNGFSDWSSFPSERNSKMVRLHRKKSSIVVEMKDKKEDEWVFMRISPWFKTQNNYMGIYTCRPSEKENDKDFPVVFHSLKVEDGVSGSFHHTSEA